MSVSNDREPGGSRRTATRCYASAVPSITARSNRSSPTIWPRVTPKTQHSEQIRNAPEAEMHEAFWNGLFDTRWEDAPLGREAIRLVLWLRKRGYRERSCRAYAHAVVHLGRLLQEGQADVRSGALDEALLTDFIEHHLPVCRCYHQRPGRRQDH